MAWAVARGCGRPQLSPQGTQNSDEGRELNNVLRLPHLRAHLIVREAKEAFLPILQMSDGSSQRSPAEAT